MCPSPGSTPGPGWPSERAIRHAWLTDLIRQIHADVPRHLRLSAGARRARPGPRSGGRGGGVWLLMRKAGLRGLSGRPACRRVPPTAAMSSTGVCPQRTGPSLGHRHRAPRGGLEPCGGERTPPCARRSERIEAEGGLIPGARGRVDSSPDNDGTGRHCQLHGHTRRTRSHSSTRDSSLKSTSRLHRTQGSPEPR